MKRTVRKINRRSGKSSVTDDPKTWNKSKSEADYAKLYEEWHWGVKPDEVVTWDDPLVPDKMIEIGRCWEFHVVSLQDKKRKNKKVMEIRDRSKNDSYVAFDPHHAAQRIHLLLSPKAMQDAQRIYDEYDVKPMPLRYWAKKAGGRHGKMRDYPDVEVKPIGLLSDIVYRCHKKGDDDHMRGSSYIHRMGEAGGTMPILTVDGTGRLWIAGGSYICPVEGISY